MIRTAIWLLFAAVILIISFPVVLVLLLFKKKSGAAVRAAVQRFVDLLIGPVMKLAGAKVVRSGMENIPEGAALFVGNHQGGFDAAIAIGYLGPVKSIVMKKEISKVPVARQWMDLLGCIYMDRASAKDCLRCITQAQELLENGRSVVIFPEGTRSRGPRMGELKAGSLRCAVRAGVPIVPFVIDGSYRLFEEKHRLTPTQVRVSVLPPVDTSRFGIHDTKELAQELQRLMQNELDAIQKGADNA